MAAKDGRGGVRPGAGRKPIPADDVARIKRMLAAAMSKGSISKTLGYSKGTVINYARKFGAEK